MNGWVAATGLFAIGAIGTVAGDIASEEIRGRLDRLPGQTTAVLGKAISKRDCCTDW